MSGLLTLKGFIIHARPYQEKRAIYTFFCHQHGMIDGVGTRGLPLFMPMTVFARGKGALKNFSQPEIEPDYPVSFGLPSTLQFASLYLNELLYKLLPKEEPFEGLWRAYYYLLKIFAKKDNHAIDEYLLKILLRQFEIRLFIALGVPIVFDYDDLANPIKPVFVYHFVLETGFVISDTYQVATQPINQTANQTISQTIGQTINQTTNLTQKTIQFTGKQLIAMAKLTQLLTQLLDNQVEFWVDAQEFDLKVLDKQALRDLGVIHRMVVDYLLDFKPLYSRQLWQDQLRLTKL